MKPFIPQKARHRVIVNPRPSAPGPMPAPMQMTVVKLPPAFGAGDNAVAVLVPRKTTTDNYATLWLGRTYCFNGTPPDSYAHLGKTKGFGWSGKMSIGTRDGSITDHADLEPDNPFPNGFAPAQPELMQVQLAGVDQILPECHDFDALADATLLFCGKEIMSIARAQMTAAGAYTLTVLRGRLGTPIPDHAAGDPLWIVERSRLKAFTHPFFAAGNAAKFKVTIGRQTPADAIPFTIKL